VPGVHTLRSLDDAAAIRQELEPGRRLLILGGGWIGLEVAATARRLGVEVMLVESGPRLCARSVPPAISDFLLQLHRREGVDVHLMGSVSKVEPAPDSGLSVHTHKGTQLFDAMVLGIGLDPNVDLAVACGLAVDNGVVVDARGQTSDPRIFAVGDVANQPCFWIGAPGGTRIRLESWANAQSQGIALGKVLAGKQDSPRDQPWFWSDQYDVNLQVLGMPSAEGAHVLRGSIEEARFCMFQIVDQRVQSVIAVNMPKELKLAKRWSKQGRCPSLAELQDLTLRLDRL
jgi:3-phenylpropionate/trans-cinnamate dioxygenase ferredoxin reductase subunit